MISSDIMHGFSIIILVFSIALNCQARPTDEHGMTQQTYSHSFPNGSTRLCLWVECDPGSEVIVCEKPNTSDQCRPCTPPFIQPDKTNSGFITMCYRVTCPEYSKLDENGKCICDTDIGYYGNYFYDCKYKNCLEGQKLTKWGYCVDKKFDLIPIKSTPEPKPKNIAQDKNMTNLKPVKISDNNQDSKKTHSQDNNSVLSLRNKSIGSIGDKKENDDRPTEVFLFNEVNFHPISFLYGCLALIPVFIFAMILYLVCRIRKKQKNELDCVMKTQTQKQVPKGRQVESTHITDNQTWKQVPAGSLPLRFRFPGQGQFNKPPSLKPTLYAALPDKFEVGKSIGILHVENEPWGTGFVVGNGHVMTCLHTIIFMLGIRAETENGIQLEIKQHIYKVKISFHFNLVSSRNDDSCFGFEQSEIYFDTNLDVIVLKIDRSCWNYQHLPRPLTRFCDLLPSSQFDFFGHPHGEKKQVDENCRIKTLSSSMIDEKRYKVAQYLRGKNFDLQVFLDPYDGILNNGCYLFTTLFVAGGSGSPGITFSERSNPDSQTYAVGTMLCGEYPNFAPNQIPHDDLNTDLKIQFGTKMSSIFSSMKQTNPHLLMDVFKVYPQQWDQLSCT
ncbi:hypothetical protein CHS0354_020888 [Potamilus streckersoni]|uniref:Serine protease n=1 Tax=Potamilus streckersoni TaxID=2493646 RepID=A0AAE0SV37_9BIVA|nr:hypothetical protein CHS0354_020888 [Potamilus streckersoni]